MAIRDDLHDEIMLSTPDMSLRTINHLYEILLKLNERVVRLESTKPTYIPTPKVILQLNQRISTLESEIRDLRQRCFPLIGSLENQP